MRKAIRFGGRRGSGRSRDNVDASLSAVLEQLSWKYVKAEAEFSPTNSFEEIEPDDLRGSIAHWAGRVWCHANEVPSGIALRKFDLMELKEPFRRYLDKHGGKIFDDGLEVEEIWASQQLHDASPVAAFVADRHKSLLTPRMTPVEIQSSQAIVWTLAAMCFLMPEILEQQGFNVLVTDGKVGHTIYIKGINGIDFEHPRGTSVRAGWFSFHDPWPARSLLAPERKFADVRALEDITRPPLWLISPADLDSVIVGYFLPVDVLPAFQDIFRARDQAEAANHGRAAPIWLDQRSSDPNRPFGILFDSYGPVAPTTAEALFGLGRARMMFGELDSAMDCFEGAANLGLPGVSGGVAELLALAGHRKLAEAWSRRHPENTHSTRAGTTSR